MKAQLTATEQDMLLELIFAHTSRIDSTKDEKARFPWLTIYRKIGCMETSVIVHGFPLGGVTICCGKNPFELGRGDRMTLHADSITCQGKNTL